LLIFIIGFTPSLNGQIVNPITVTTDKSLYYEDETIVISGEVSEILYGYAVSLLIIDPNGDAILIDQLIVARNKKFQTEITAGGQMNEIGSGMYTVSVLYATENRTASTTFQYVSSGTSTQPPITISTDKSVYKENEVIYFKYFISKRIPNEKLSIKLYDPHARVILIMEIPNHALSLHSSSYTPFFPPNNGWGVGGAYSIIAEYGGSKSIQGVKVITSPSEDSQVIDKDNDGIPDYKDQCPSHRESYNEYPQWLDNLGIWFVEKKITNSDLNNAFENLFDRKIILGYDIEKNIIKAKVIKQIIINGAEIAEIQPYVIRGGDRVEVFLEFNATETKVVLYEISLINDPPSSVDLCPDCKKELRIAFQPICEQFLKLDCEPEWYHLELWFGEYLLEIDGDQTPVTISEQGSSSPFLKSKTTSGLMFCYGNVMDKESCDFMSVPERNPNAPIFNKGACHDEYCWGEKPEWYETYIDSGEFRRDMRFFDCPLNERNTDRALEIAFGCLYSGGCNSEDRDEYLRDNFC